MLKNNLTFMLPNSTFDSKTNIEKVRGAFRSLPLSTLEVTKANCRKLLVFFLSLSLVKSRIWKHESNAIFKHMYNYHDYQYSATISSKLFLYSPNNTIEMLTVSGKAHFQVGRFHL